MKWVLICVLIVVIMLIAISLSEQYKDKFDFYFNLKQFLNQFKINVAFKQEKLNKFLQKLNCKKNFKIFVLDYQNYLKTGKIDLSNLKILENDEKIELENIVKNIGKFDKHNEINQLEGFILSIEEKLKIAQENKAKMCPMIIKLSLLFALAMSILLI